MKQQRQLIREQVASLETEFLVALKRVMKIASVKGPASEQAPFGIKPKEAIVEALAIGTELGFETRLVNNAMGYVSYGAGADYLGVVGHLDVVAAGTGWNYEPFDLTIIDGVAYGRGVLDNKGPAISTLFALYALKKLAIPLTQPLRIIFGSDEESGSADVPLYLASERAPRYGFTPDCKYPAVYGERGILGLSIVTKFATLQELAGLEGNFNASWIPDFTEISWRDGTKTSAYGKRAPSNAPELGRNSITRLAQKIVAENQLKDEPLLAYFTWLATSLDKEHDGAAWGIDFSDEDSGKLQLVPYELIVNGSEIQLNLSIRYPISVTATQIVTQMTRALFPNSELKVTRSLPASIFPKEHPMLAVMADVYEYVTGEDGTPVTTTGATYARQMPNLVAFGPSFPGQKGIAHKENEYMTVSDLMKNMEIYAITLAELAK